MHDKISISVTDGEFDAFVSRPSDGPAPAVVVLHEVFGVNADMRTTCDELAERGFIAICPDLFWRQERNVSLDSWSDAEWRKGLALYTAYDRDRGVRDIQAVVETARAMDSSTGKVAVMGFCLGGLMTFLSAARGELDAAVAFHGAETDQYLREAKRIYAPMIMHLAEDDEFIPPEAQASIKTELSGMSNVEVFSYPHCQHAFARHTGVHFNAEAAALAYSRTWAFLAKALGLERGDERGLE